MKATFTCINSQQLQIKASQTGFLREDGDLKRGLGDLENNNGCQRNGERREGF